MVGVNDGNDALAPTEAFSIDSAGLVDVVNDANVGGALGVTGAATFTAQSVHNGGIDVNGTGDVSDTLTLSKATGTGLAVTADATVGGTLGVTGAATFTAESVHNGGVDVNGNADVSGTLGVTGVATFTAESVHNGGIDVNGTGDVSDTLTLSKATGTGLAVTADATVGGTLGVTGDATVGGTLGVTGTATFTAESVHNGGIDVNGTGNVSDTLTLSKATGTGLAVTADATVGGTLGVTGAATFTAESVHNGGIDVNGNADVSGNLGVGGDLTVSGTLTYLDTEILRAVDKNIEMNYVDGTTETDVSADGGGLTLHGTTDKTFNWVDATDAWTSSEHIDLASGKSLLAAGTELLSATQLTIGTSSFSDTQVVANGLDINGTGDVSDTLTLSKATGTGLDVTADALIGGTLGVTGATTFTAETVHNGGIDVNGTGDVSDTLTLSKATGTGLDVTADALIGGTLGVTGVATFTAESVHNGGISSGGQITAVSTGGTSAFNNGTVGSALRLEQNDVESDPESSIGKGLQIYGFQPSILFTERDQNRHWQMFSDAENVFHIGRIQTSSLVNTVDEQVTIGYPSDSVDTFTLSDEGILLRGFVDGSQSNVSLTLDCDKTHPVARRSVVQWTDRSVPSYDFGHVDINNTVYLNVYLRGTVTDATDSGTGLININDPSHGLTTGNTVVISRVEGTTEANGTWTVTVVDSDNFTLDSSTFTNAYTSGGLWYRTVGGGGYASTALEVGSDGVVGFSQESVHNGGIDVNGNADVSGTLGVTGVATFTAESVHNGGIDVNGTGDVSDTLTLSKATGTGLAVTADATVGGTLGVTGTATFTAESVHNGGIDVNGTGDVSDTLTLSKATGTGLAVTADATVGGTLGVTGTATFTAESVHNGGIDVNGNADVSGNLVVGGDFTVNGTTTTVNTTTLNVEDKNISLGYVDGVSETDASADGGGITLEGTTDKTFNWVNATDAWTSSEHIDLASGKSLMVNGTEVVTSTQIVLDSAGQAGIVYLGDPSTDNTWRMTVDGNGDLVFQARISGTYVDKFSVTK